MTRRIAIRLTAEDRAAISRWWRIMISTVALFAIAFIALEGSRQSRAPTLPDLAQNLSR